MRHFCGNSLQIQYRLGPLFTQMKWIKAHHQIILVSVGCSLCGDAQSTKSSIRNLSHFFSYLALSAPSTVTHSTTIRRSELFHFLNLTWIITDKIIKQNVRNYMYLMIPLLLYYHSQIFRGIKTIFPIIHRSLIGAISSWFLRNYRGRSMVGAIPYDPMARQVDVQLLPNV